MADKDKFKSGLERKVHASLNRRQVKHGYETQKFKFVQPAKARTYTPDFFLHETGIFVECKGRLTQADREKLLWAREQNPDLRLVILFGRAKNTLTRRSKTTYGDWAEKNGFEWADFGEDGIPASWYKKEKE